MQSRWIQRFAAIAAVSALMCGTAAAERGVSPTEIRIGTAALTGPIAAPEIAEGAKLYFDAVNAAGGVHGRKISYAVMDDGLDPRRAVENARKLLGEGDSFLLLGSTGTGPALALIPVVEREKAILFAPITGSPLVREKFSRYVFHVRPSYDDEALRLVRHVRDSGVARAVLVYQDDPLGLALVDAARKAARQLNFKFAAEIQSGREESRLGRRGSCCTPIGPAGRVGGHCGHSRHTLHPGHAAHHHAPHLLRAVHLQPPT